MLPRTILALLGLALSILAQGGEHRPAPPAPPPPPNLLHEGETALSDMVQITFDGKKSGEAYFSPDESMICFQSVRGACPHYQIFVQRLDGTRLVQITPGQGLTTCAYFHPTESRLIWASTHLDPATFPPPPPNAGPYVWDKHPSFDIFESDLEGKEVRRLTTSPGYDAEGSFSPDGSRICFTSQRDDDLEIYTMARDGSDVRRVTNAKGYDGGPFFSPDGKKICFRGFRDPQNPRYAQIYVIDADGQNEKQLTFDQAVNWCPYFSPCGKWLIYAKNVGSPRNFELFLVPVAGGDSIRLTTNPDADVLPVFSKDGKRIMWTSSRVGGKSQVFIANLAMPPLPAPK